MRSCYDTDRVVIHGAALRVVRELCNVSTAELAKSCGVSKSTLSRLETSVTQTCARDTYALMLNRLGIDPENYGALLVPVGATRAKESVA